MDDFSQTQYSQILKNGQAMVKLIEGLLVLQENSGSWRETLLINLTLALYRHRLREAIKILPADIADEILLGDHLKDLGVESS